MPAAQGRFASSRAMCIFPWTGDPDHRITVPGHLNLACRYQLAGECATRRVGLFAAALRSAPGEGEVAVGAARCNAVPLAAAGLGLGGDGPRPLNGSCEQALASLGQEGRRNAVSTPSSKTGTMEGTNENQERLRLLSGHRVALRRVLGWGPGLRLRTMVHGGDVCQGAHALRPTI